MVVLYDPNEMQLSFIFRWRGTIFPLVLADPLFWVLITFHTSLLFYQHWSIENGQDGLPALEWEASTVVMGLLTFFLVFYSNHCYERYLTLHKHSTTIGRSVYQWSQLVQLYFSHLSPAHRWNVMRKFLGAMQTHYAYVRREGDDFGISDDEWRAMRRARIFTKEEVAVLSEHTGFRPLLATTWALNEVKLAILSAETDEAKRSAVSGGAMKVLTSMPQISVFNEFLHTARILVDHASDSMEVLRQPVPFPYFHIVKLLLLIAMLILSYALIVLEGPTGAVLSLAIYFVSCVVMLGVQEIAIGMSDPFGLDDVDFDIDGFLKHSYESAVAQLQDEVVPSGARLASEFASSESAPAGNWRGCAPALADTSSSVADFESAGLLDPPSPLDGASTTGECDRLLGSAPSSSAASHCAPPALTPAASTTPAASPTPPVSNEPKSDSSPTSKSVKIPPSGTTGIGRGGDSPAANKPQARRKQPPACGRPAAGSNRRDESAEQRAACGC